jgi:FtsP/CotA-like multicopper oxidase with cupredoxin domain
MHFHGVEYEIGSAGAYIPGVSGPGADVPPGGTFTYKLKAVPASAGVWPYHDHSPSMMDSTTGGMYGALSIVGKGERAPNKEFVVFFESQLKLNTIDGLAFIGNTPTFRFRWKEDRVGTWLYHCHVESHMMNGMIGLYVVTK